MPARPFALEPTDYLYRDPSIDGYDAAAGRVAETLLCGDSWLRRPERSRPVWNSTCSQSYRWSVRHGGGANYVFLDGHAKWLAPEAISAIECARTRRN